MSGWQLEDDVAKFVEDPISGRIVAPGSSLIQSFKGRRIRVILLPNLVQDHLIRVLGLAEDVHHQEQIPANGANDHHRNCDQLSLRQLGRFICQMVKEPDAQKTQIFQCDGQEEDERPAAFLQLEHEGPDQKGGDPEEEKDEYCQ